MENAAFKRPGIVSKNRINTVAAIGITVAGGVVKNIAILALLAVSADRAPPCGVHARVFGSGVFLGTGGGLCPNLAPGPNLSPG